MWYVGVPLFLGPPMLEIMHNVLSALRRAHVEEFTIEVIPPPLGCELKIGVIELKILQDLQKGESHHSLCNFSGDPAC